MATTSSEIHLTPELWNALRKGMLELQTCPIWVTEIASWGFGEVKQLPARVNGLSVARPQILACDKRAYLVALENVRYGSDSSELDRIRKSKIDALKQHKCDRIIELQLARRDGLFRSIFADRNFEVIHAETLPGYFVVVPKWQQVLSVWRGILVMAMVFAAIAFFSTSSITNALPLFAASFVLFVSSVFALGKSHVIECGLFVSMVTLLAGLLIKVWWAS